MCASRCVVCSGRLRGIELLRSHGGPFRIAAMAGNDRVVFEYTPRCGTGRGRVLCGYSAGMRGSGTGNSASITRGASKYRGNGARQRKNSAAIAKGRNLMVPPSPSEGLVAPSELRRHKGGTSSVFQAMPRWHSASNSSRTWHFFTASCWFTMPFVTKRARSWSSVCIPISPPACSWVRI